MRRVSFSFSTLGPPANFIMPNIQLKFGPMLIGVFINMILYGVLLVQTYTYYQVYKRDAAWIRYLVWYLFVVETANTVFDMYIMYEPLIIRYGLPEATQLFPTLFASEPLVIVAVSTPIQLFFAWRIKVLTKSNWVAGVISLFAIVSLAGGIWTGTMIVILKYFANKPQLHNPALVWFLSSCVADVLITISLVISLSKRRTGFVATDDAISKIIRMTVQTGMLTALFAIGDVVFFMTLPHTALNFVWDLALSKLYTNCLLSTLNARATLKEMTQVSSHGARNALADASGRRAHMHGSVVYELDTHKSFDAASTFARGEVDIEYGITVTKVVERLADNFEPGMRETTQ